MPKDGAVNNPALMDEFCQDNGFIGWYLTSAKDNINIEDAANCLVTKILKKQKSLVIEESQTNNILLGNHSHQFPKERKCC
ncbi:ras-related protein Rab-32-like [Tachypleus tridentatus]